MAFGDAARFLMAQLDHNTPLRRPTTEFGRSRGYQRYGPDVLRRSVALASPGGTRDRALVESQLS